ncbi:GL15179 [Drosophila persimilis]|uniref:Dihydrolipoamide acetyltransferase component of pyruvate dehydrogenase complex n=1 Tax=Drosophila persimilis TaxID=7234 RepID=B4H3M6_DROPE|nr:GL15179 [Drosophila persimilis]
MATHLLRNGASSWLLKNYLSRHQTLKRCLHVTPSLDKTVSFNLSDIGEGIREVTVKEWFVKVGDTVEQFDNLCEVQSDKASVTITSRYDGKITKIHHSIDEIALVGKPLLDFDVLDEEGDENSTESSSSSSDSSSSEAEAAKPSAGEAVSINGGRVITPATPAVRRLAKEHQLDLANVPPTGKNGRVLKGDILEYLGQVPPGTNIPHPTIAAKQQSQVARTTAGTAAGIPADRVEVLKGVRKAMLKAMTESLKIPHFAYSDEIDMSNLVQFRAQAAGNGQGERSVDLASESLVYKGAHNISVAIDTPQGLIGGTYTHPCIMAPQVAIGAMGRTKAVPRFNDKDEVVKAQIMSVSWSADHRVIDGVTMASFSNVWKQYLEQPALFLLH